MKNTEHGNLVDTDMAGNGYHGRCEHCGLALVTDLGYTSWSGTKCIEREITRYEDIPDEIQNYMNWKNLSVLTKEGVSPMILVKRYTDERYTLDEINEIVQKIKR
jgi:hypothetical protein